MFKEYTNIREENGQWISTVYEYVDSSKKGHPIKSYNEAVPAPVTELPETKAFDTGYVHLQFDISTQEYKDFCADPRTSEFLNNQKVEMSYLGVQFRKNLVAVLVSDSIITQATADKLNLLLDSWAAELKIPES